MSIRIVSEMLILTLIVLFDGCIPGTDHTSAPTQAGEQVFSKPAH